MTNLNENDILAAIVAGERAKQQIADRLDVSRHSQALWELLTRLECHGSLCMEVVNAEWHYKPTKKGRDRASAGHVQQPSK